MAAFYQATQELGVANQVTTFTLSEFSRTFQPGSNGGTDHAWGGHQMVMGGAVKGNALRHVPDTRAWWTGRYGEQWSMDPVNVGGSVRGDARDMVRSGECRSSGHFPELRKLYHPEFGVPRLVQSNMLSLLCG